MTKIAEDIQYYGSPSRRKLIVIAGLAVLGSLLLVSSCTTLDIAQSC